MTKNCPRPPADSPAFSAHKSSGHRYATEGHGLGAPSRLRSPCRVRLYGAAESGRVVEALPSDHGNIPDECVMFGSVWRLCFCGQWHTSRKPTRVQQCGINSASVLSFPATLRLACPRETCKTSRLSLDLLRHEFHWRPESSCTTVARHETLREVAAHREHRWGCVEEATENKTERLREATSHNQPTMQRRTTDPHKEDKPLEDLKIRPFLRLTPSLKIVPLDIQTKRSEHRIEREQNCEPDANHSSTYAARRDDSDGAAIVWSLRHRRLPLRQRYQGRAVSYRWTSQYASLTICKNLACVDVVFTPAARET